MIVSGYLVIHHAYITPTSPTMEVYVDVPYDIVWKHILPKMGVDQLWCAIQNAIHKGEHNYMKQILLPALSEIPHFFEAIKHRSYHNSSVVPSMITYIVRHIANDIGDLLRIFRFIHIPDMSNTQFWTHEYCWQTYSDIAAIAAIKKRKWDIADYFGDLHANADTVFKQFLQNPVIIQELIHRGWEFSFRTIIRGLLDYSDGYIPRISIDVLMKALKQSSNMCKDHQHEWQQLQPDMQMTGYVEETVWAENQKYKNDYYLLHEISQILSKPQPKQKYIHKSLVLYEKTIQNRGIIKACINFHLRLVEYESSDSD